MWTGKIGKSRNWLCLPLALLLWLAAGSISQAETMYQISETELTALEENLQTLKTHNQERQKVLTEQATLLNQQQGEMKELQTEIANSKTANEETKKSLQKANESLNKLEQEAKRKIRAKTRQRNLWIAISAGLLYACVKK